MRKSIPSPRGAARSRLLAGVLFGLTLAWQTNAFAALPTGDGGVPDLDDENNAPRIEGAVDPASAFAVSPGAFAWRHAAGEEISRRICPLLESAAVDNDLPVDFFLRLIWQESRFDTRSVSHAGARGIAQFMPATARMRGLKDPFDPAQAIPKSAELLRELREKFGNIGLAAAAYNAGSGRVTAWLGGRGGLPRETQAYVVITTGHSADDWISSRFPLSDGLAADTPSCAALAMQAPEERVQTVGRSARRALRRSLAAHPRTGTRMAARDVPHRRASSARGRQRLVGRAPRGGRAS